MPCQGETAARHRRLRQDLRADTAVVDVTLIPAREDHSGRTTTEAVIASDFGAVPPSVLREIADHDFGVVAVDRDGPLGQSHLVVRIRSVI